MRGIFFSIDAILALLLALSISALILNTSSRLQATTIADSQLQKIADDSLVSMDKSGVLGSSVVANSANPLKEFARIIPGNVCYRIAIYPQSLSTPMIAQENCACRTYSISRRSFVLPEPGTAIYLAEMRACYKGTSG